MTSSENNKHAWEKELKESPNFKGENHPNAKLNDEVVKEIREKYKSSEYSYSKLAKEYNIDRSMIGKIVKFQYWKHVV